jgi:hypothetical protein
MIRVVKPGSPDKLLEFVALTAEHCALHDADPATYDSGDATFEILSANYGHSLVKDVLRAAQYSKCCFCEGMFEANAAADVEHYRPKKYSQQGRNRPKMFPGYYWLGYRWDNLFYSCQICNRSHKKNFFPLRNPASRVRHHAGNIATEEPLILNPAGPADPRDHIHFTGEVAVGSSDEGDTTIDYCGLNRLPLIEARLEHFKMLQRLRQVTTLPMDSAEAVTIIHDAEAFLATAVLPTAKFSAMAQDALAA